MIKNLIYGLYCPFTGCIHYVGKSTSGMTRPLQHLNSSHSDKIKEWVDDLKFLGYKPIIKILEECDESNIDVTEVHWIEHMTDKGEYLLNYTYNTARNILNKKEYSSDKLKMFKISNFIKETRKLNKISSTQFSKDINVDRTTLYQIEKGNTSIKFFSVLKALDYLGYEFSIQKKQ